MVQKFKEGGYQFWDGETNGIPVSMPSFVKAADRARATKGAAATHRCPKPRELCTLRFWEYSRNQFEKFLVLHDIHVTKITKKIT